MGKTTTIRSGRMKNWEEEETMSRWSSSTSTSTSTSLSEQISSKPTPWSSRASSQRPSARSLSYSISSRGSSPSLTALARNGYHDGAIAGAIGSQVINISLGVGLPALFVCLTGGGYLRIEHGQASSLWLLTCLLVVVIVSYIGVTLPISRMWSERRLLHSTVVTKASATVQLCVWGLVYFTFIYLNEG